MAKYTPNTLSGDLAPVNAELEKIRDSLNSQLDRSPAGASNQMETALDMNSNYITNLPAPVNANDAARKADVDAIVVAENLITGNVGSTDNALVRANGTTGLSLQGSTATLNDAGDMSANSLAVNTSLTGATITDGTATLTSGSWTGLVNLTLSGTIDTGQGATEVYLMNQNVRSTDDVTFNNMTVDGNLVVNGTTTTVDSTTLTVADPLIVLGQGNASNTLDMGFVAVRASNNAGFIWDESLDEFACILTTDDGSTSGNVAISSYANFQAGAITATTINTGQGNNELYAMNQSVQTGDSVTFANLTVQNAGTPLINITSTGGGDSYSFRNAAGTFQLYNNTDGRADLSLDGAGTWTLGGSLQAAGLTSTNGLSVTSGTVTITPNATFSGTITSTGAFAGANILNLQNTDVNGLGVYIAAASGGNAALDVRDYLGNALFDVKGNGDATFGGVVDITRSTAGEYASFGGSTDGGQSRPLKFSSEDVGAFLGARHYIDASSGSGEIVLQTGGVDRVNITSSGVTFSGNVGIGVASDSVAAAKVNGALAIVDGMTAPATITGYASIYVDSADGDLKVKFADGTVKTIATDT